MSTQPEEHSMKHHKRPLAGYEARTDRKSTRLNSSHTVISYAVFCLKKKKKKFVSLIGHSGCDKSTLLNIVTGLLEPSDGHFFLAKTEMKWTRAEHTVVFRNDPLRRL